MVILGYTYKKQYRKVVSSFALASILFVVNGGSLVFAQNNSHPIAMDLVATVPQDFNRFLAPDIKDQCIVDYNATSLMHTFLRHYFSPWHNTEFLFDTDEILNNQTKAIQDELSHPGFGLNSLPIDVKTIESIRINMSMDTFPNVKKQKGIVICGTHLRQFPSHYTSFDEPQHYPFDNWQESFLITNEPLCVIHQSKDKKWCLVCNGHYAYGWVLRKDIAYVSPAFITKWQTGKYITPLFNNVSIDINSFIPSPSLRIGQVIPVSKKKLNTIEQHKVLIVVANSKGYAEIKEGLIDQQKTAIMPLAATPSNMSQLAANFFGQPYGWGGLEEYQDCSELMKDLFMPFAIWLPRDSGSQALSGAIIDLKDKSDEEKKHLISQKGIPFFSLITLRGHIALYIGNYEDTPYIYHTMWGLRLKTDPNGRAIMGKVVLMPVDFGKTYEDIANTILTRVDGLLVLSNRLAHPDEALPLFNKSEPK